MALSKKLKEKISIEVIKTLISRFNNFPKYRAKNRNAPFHEAFLKAFSKKLKGKVSNKATFISLSSWLHGFNATLGQTFFENVAHHLCNGSKKQFKSNNKKQYRISKTQAINIDHMMKELKNAEVLPNLKNENLKIFKKFNTKSVKASNFTADIFIEKKHSIIAIELKSVKPNSGEMNNEKRKILGGKAVLYNNFPGKKISFYIGFPFDPTDCASNSLKTHFNKQRFMASIVDIRKYFDEKEVLIANGLWNFLSNKKNTMEEILEIINTISTPKFLSEFKFLRESKNKEGSKYLKLLLKWNLFSEYELRSNNKIINKINNNKKLKNLFNKCPFNIEGDFDDSKYKTIKKRI